MCREGEEDRFLRLRLARAGDQVLGCRLLSPPCGSRLLRLLRLLGTTGGWTNYSSCVQQMWNMLEVGGRGKYSTHSTLHVTDCTPVTAGTQDCSWETFSFGFWISGRTELISVSG